MKKLVLVFLFVMFSLNFICADYITHQQNVDYNFSVTSNFATNCTLSNINSPNGIISINQTDENSGSFDFFVAGSNYSSNGVYCHNIICTDGSETTSGNECIEISLSGVQKNMTLIIADIFLIILISLLIFILSRHYSKNSYGDSNKNIAQSHNGNWGRTFIKTLGTNLMKNSFLWYYSLGWLMLIVVKDLIYNFSTTEIYNFFILCLDIYSFGFFLIIAVWIGILISHFTFITDLINDMNIGVSK